MLITQEQAAKTIRHGLRPFVYDKKVQEEGIKYAEEQFNLPSGRLADYYTGRLSVDEAKIDIMWYLANIVDHVNGNTKVVDKIFTEVEKRQLKGIKFKVLKADFPMRIKCFKVTEDQWIGASDSKFLMKLRASQLINYNVNAQRVMKRRIVDGNVVFENNVNRKEVDEICKSLEAGTFIPNTITLNIPDSEYDFGYDDKANELVINSLDHFDIPDGYHRYIALSRISDMHEDFNYPIELRVIHFEDSKARFMAGQEMKGMRMSRVDADSMDTMDVCNRVTERVNADPMCDWMGHITRYKSLVDFASFSSLVRYFYYMPNKPNGKEAESKFVREIARTLSQKINIATTASEELNGTVDFRMLSIMFYCMKTYDDPKEIVQHIQMGLYNKSRLGSRFNGRLMSRGMAREIAAIV